MPFIADWLVMPIAVTCPQCSRRHQAPETLAGRQAKCGCGAILAVPTPTVHAPPSVRVAVASAAPAKVTARPSGSWHIHAAPEPAPTVPTGPSVFDDVSSADLGRGKRVATPAAATLADSPRFTPSGSITSEFIDRARNELAERERAAAEKLPHSVSLAIAGLAVPGALALAAGFAFLLALGSNILEDFGSEFMIIMFVVCTLFAALEITSGVLLYLRVPYSRPLCYVAGVVTLIAGCGNPLNFLCAMLTLWFLSTPETTQYLARKGAPGVIDW